MRSCNILVAAFVFLHCVGCAAKIERDGYELKDQEMSDVPNCSVVIKNCPNIDKTHVMVLGRIEASDTGLSIECDEFDVLTLFIKEACALEADIINITE